MKDLNLMVENMISWAKERLGNPDYAGWCLSFIEDALEISNDIEIFGGDCAKESSELYSDALHTGLPEKGAFVFYDCLCPSESGLVNWGHCGIALDGGKLIHAWDIVRIDDYLEIEKLTALTGDHPKYLGWVPLRRVLAEKRNNHMILYTERLILRPWCDADAESLYEYAKDERVGPAAGWPPHTSVENSREVIRNVLSEPETYAVCLKEDNKPIGSIGLMIGKNSNLNLPENEGEIGYWIGVPFWGQGLIPEAVREMIRYAFADLGLQTLWCGYFDGNEKSRRVQEKCGFVYHHTNKDIEWKLMHRVFTEHVTCLPKEAWKSAQ